MPPDGFETQVAKKPKKRKKRVVVSMERFVRAWKTAHRDGVSMAEVARRLGVSYNYVLVTKKALIKAGVNLPELPKTSSEVINVAKLNAILEGKE